MYNFYIAWLWMYENGIDNGKTRTLMFSEYQSCKIMLNEKWVSYTVAWMWIYENDIDNGKLRRLWYLEWKSFYISAQMCMSLVHAGWKY